MSNFKLQLIVQAIDKVSAPARKMGKALSAIAKRSGLDKVGRAIGAVGRQLGKVAKEAWSFGTSLAAAAAAAGAAMFALLKKTANAADSAVKVADKLGITIEQLQRMRYAAELNGISLEKHDMAMQRFIRRAAEAAEGTGEAKKALAEMGITLKDNNGNLRPAEELLADVAGAFEKIEDPAKRVRVAFKLFDSEGVDMVRMLSKGSDEMRAMYEEAGKLGIVTEKQARQSEAFNDNLLRLWTTLKNIAQNIAFELMPNANEFLVYLRELAIEARPRVLEILKKVFKEIGRIIIWVKNVWKGLTDGMSALNKSVLISIPILGAFIKKIAVMIREVGFLESGIKLLAAIIGGKLLMAILGLFKPLLTLIILLGKTTLSVLSLSVGIMGGLMKALYAFTPAIWLAVKAVVAFTAALLANPITWVVIAIVGLIAAAWGLVKNWKQVAEFLINLWHSIRQAVMESINNLISWILGLDMVGVGREWIGGMIDAIKEKWQEFTSWFVDKAEKVASIFGFEGNIKGAALAPAVPSALQQNQRTEVGGSIKVDFTNLPQGARVTEINNNNQGVGIDVDAGYAMATP